MSRIIQPVYANTCLRRESLPCAKSRVILGWLATAVAILSGCHGSGSKPENSKPESNGLAVVAPHIERSNSESSTAALVVRELFKDVSAATGVDFTYSNGRSANEFAIIESLGGGLGAFDFDLDGNLDVMFAGGGRLDEKTVRSRPCGLFRNLGAWRFRNVTGLAQTPADAFFTHGVYSADFDGDGFDDLSISGYGGVQLLLNMGDGTFESLEPLVTNTQNAWSSSLAWADLDYNGHLDLYVAHYVDWSWKKHPICAGQGSVVREVCAPKEFAGMADVVYFNDGELQFRQASESIGLVPGGKGLGVVVGDVNSDNYVDVYVANDTTDNHLYLNDGNGRFTEAAVLSSVSGDDAGVSTGSMGACIFDYNGDQLPDIFVSNFERELSALYRNEGEGFFAFASRQAGFAAYEAGFVGFGTVAIDFDFDGDQDIVVANGHVSYHSPYAPYRQLPLIFENQQGKQFRRLHLTGYFARAHTGRGLASGDFDNDGAADLAFSHLEEPVAILKSPTPTGRSWAILRLVGTRSNRAAIGATVSLEVDGTAQKQFLCGGGSYLSHSDRRMHLYWAENSTAARIVIQWPSGEREEFLVQPFRETVLLQGGGQLLSIREN